MNKKFIGISEKLFLIILLVAIVLMMTLFRGNSDIHNKVMETILLVAFMDIALKLLLKAKKRKYFIPGLLINFVGVIFSFVQVLHPVTQDNFSGGGRSLTVIPVVLSLFIIDIILAKLNSNHRIKS